MRVPVMRGQTEVKWVPLLWLKLSGTGSSPRHNDTFVWRQKENIGIWIHQKHSPLELQKHCPIHIMYISTAHCPAHSSIWHYVLFIQLNLCLELVIIIIMTCFGRKIKGSKKRKPGNNRMHHLERFVAKKKFKKKCARTCNTALYVFPWPNSETILTGELPFDGCDLGERRWIARICGKGSNHECASFCTIRNS